ncbi:MAG TPA: FtsX-like permease family protein [Candidatus Limnocylindrales bacterium]|nr:FtsX-like permease family protein [Candidatus Limnocylindrales bacterium]
MRSLWAAGMLLRRLRSEGGVILLIFVLVAGTSFVFAAAPRLFNRVSDDALSYAVRTATPVQRTIAATLMGNISAGEGDGVDTIRERGERIATQFTPAIDSLIDERLLRFTTIRFLVRNPPSYDTRISLRYQDGLTEATRLVSGRWPEDHGVRLQIDAIGGPPEDPDQKPPPPNVFEAAMSAGAAAEVGVKLGDRLSLTLDGSEGLIRGLPFALPPTQVEIVGLYEPIDATAPYWFADTALLQPEQHGNEDAPLAYVWAYVPAAMYPNLAGSELPFHYEWRFPTDPTRVNADLVPQLQADFRRLGVNTGISASGSTRSVEIRTGIPAILERFATERAQTETVLSIATLGPFGLAAGAIAMVALLLVRRRRPTVALARGRGASGSLLLGTQLWESILVAGGGALTGLALATALIPARPASLSVTLAMAVGVLATVLLVGASWSSARRPLGNLERDDTPLRQVSPRRLVIEATIVFLAVAATLLLRERGLAGTGGTGGAGAPGSGATAAAAPVDPLLAAVPVLAGLAAGIVALRLYPLPIRVLGWLAARRRDFVPVLGLRTIGRHPGAANLPLLVLLLTAAFGAFSSTLSASIDRGQVAASYLDVGSDFRIERIGFASMPEASRIAQVPGAEAVARGLIDTSASFESTAGQRAAVYMAALEPAEYATVLAGSPADPRFPTAVLAQPEADPGTEERPIPALLSNRLPTGSTHLDLGDMFEMTVAGKRLTFSVAERRETFPGIAGRTPFAVVPLNWVQAAFERGPAPSVLWIRAASDIRAGLASAITEVGAGARVVSRPDAYDALHDAPLEAVISTGYTAALVVAAIYMALAIVGAMVLSAAGRTRDLAYLRTLGVTARQALGLTVMEHGPPVVLALIPGVALGVVIAILVEPGLQLSTFVGTSGVPLYVDWLAMAAMAGALIAVVALSVALGTWLARRARPTDALRIGEH